MIALAEFADNLELIDERYNTDDEGSDTVEVS